MPTWKYSVELYVFITSRLRALRIHHFTLVHRLGLRHLYIAAECLRQTNDDQDADGFRDCLYGITWSGGIGDNYSFDEDGEVVGLGNVVLEILPLAERSAENNGWKVLGTAPTE